MRHVKYLSRPLLLLFLTMSGACVQAQSTSPDSVDQPEIPAPAWVVGQWWRFRVTNTIEQTPRLFLHRVIEVRRDGYVVQVINETTGTITATSLLSKETNIISNAVEGYPAPSMVIETRPDNGNLEFPLKVGSTWERHYTLTNSGKKDLPSMVRGNVARAIDQDTPWGRKRTLEVKLRWQSEGTVAYQASCMYLAEIGRCVEYREGLQTARVIEAGIEK